MLWIDSHCHATDLLWSKDLEQNLDAWAKAGCQALIMGGIDPIEWKAQRALPTEKLQILKVFGLHPWTILEQDPEASHLALDELEALAGEASAIGEMGLDFFRATTQEQRKQQKDCFSRQLQIAKNSQKPCVLHVVRAYPEAWQCVQPIKPEKAGLIHSFWANRQQAKHFLDTGWVLSLHPRIRFGDPHGILQYAPRDQVVFESDSPHQESDGAWRTPLVVMNVLQHVANVWGESVEDTAARELQILQRIWPELVGQFGSLPTS